MVFAFGTAQAVLMIQPEAQRMSQAQHESSLGFTLLLKDPLSFDPSAVARILAPLEKIPTFDIISRMRLKPGVVMSCASEESARKMASLLQEKGIGTVIFPGAVLPELPLPTDNHLLSMDAAGLTIGLDGGESMVGWDKLCLIAVFAVRSSSVRKVIEKEGPSMGKAAVALAATLATGIPFGFGKSKKTERTIHESDTVFFADIQIKEACPRLRINPARATFEYLGTEKTASALENFRLTMKILVRFSPSALRNKAADLWIHHQAMAPVIIEDPELIEEEWRWLTALTIA